MDVNGFLLCCSHWSAYAFKHSLYFIHMHLLKASIPIQLNLCSIGLCVCVCFFLIIWKANGEGFWFLHILQLNSFISVLINCSFSCHAVTGALKLKKNVYFTYSHNFNINVQLMDWCGSREKRKEREREEYAIGTKSAGD